MTELSPPFLPSFLLFSLPLFLFQGRLSFWKLTVSKLVAQWKAAHLSSFLLPSGNLCFWSLDRQAGSIVVGGYVKRPVSFISSLSPLFHVSRSDVDYASATFPFSLQAA